MHRFKGPWVNFLDSSKQRAGKLELHKGSLGQPSDSWQRPSPPLLPKLSTRTRYDRPLRGHGEVRLLVVC